MVISPSGSSGAFTFTCGTLPSNALCLFNPAAESLVAGVQGNVAVEISTGNGSQVRAERPLFWHTLPLACGLILLPFAVRKRRRMFLLVLLAAILTIGVTSCASSGGGGGSGSQGSGSGTPTGTYTIPVNVTSTGITHSFRVTLTVD